MGVNGNSAICKPRGDVKLQSSSMAGKTKRAKFNDKSDTKSTLGLWFGEIIFFLLQIMLKTVLIFFTEYKSICLLKLMNTMYYYIYFF